MAELQRFLLRLLCDFVLHYNFYITKPASWLQRRCCELRSIGAKQYLEYDTTAWGMLTCSAYLLKQTTTSQLHNNGYIGRSTSYLPVTVYGKQAS